MTQPLNIIALPINSADRVNIGDSTTNFTVALRKSLRNIVAVEVSNVVIPKAELIINVNNDTLSGAILVDATVTPFDVHVPDGNYDGTTLAAALQTALNTNATMLSFPISWAVSYTTLTGMMSATATYALGAGHTWAVRVDFTAMVGVLGLGSAVTVPQTFTAGAGATVLVVPFNRVATVMQALCYNITSARLTDAINTSYLNSYGKNFDVGSANNRLMIDAAIVTAAYTRAIPKPVSGIPVALQNMGASASISSDGTIAAFGTSGNGVYVFMKISGVWEQSPLTPVGVDVFGVNGAVSGDGNTLAIGVPTEGATGAVYVYTRIGSTWTQAAHLIGTGAVGNAFQGGSVALSIDGTTLAVGGTVDNTGVGAVWIFELSGGVWAQQGAKRVPTGAIGQAVAGYSVSLSGSGDRLVFGGLSDNGNVGAFWTSDRTAGVWSAPTKFVPGVVVGAAFLGRSVSMAAGGNYLAVGSSADNTTGASWVYHWSGAAWVEQQKIIAPSRGAVGNFTTGGSVALNAAGDTLAIGAANDDLVVPVGPQGSTSVWTRVAALWSNEAANLVGDVASPSNQTQGAAVALSAAGDELVTGAPNDNGQHGAAWAFARALGVWSQDGAKLAGNGAFIVATSFGRSVSMSGDGLSLVAGVFALNGNVGGAYVYTNAGLDWVQVAELIPGDAIGAALMGTSVSMSADGTRLAFGGPGDNFAAGAVWIFDRNTVGVWLESAKVTPAGPITAIGRLVALAGATMITAGTGNGVQVNTRNIYGQWPATVAQLGAGTFQPTAIGISGDETRIIFSAPGSGVAVYRLVSGTWTAETTLTGTLVNPGTGQLGVSCAISADGLTIAASSTTDGPGSNKGYTYIFAYANGAWTQTGTGLLATPDFGSLAQGTLLSLGNNGAMLVVGDPAANAGTGAYWVFDRLAGVWTQRPGGTVGASGEDFVALNAQSAGGKIAIGASGSRNVYIFTPAGTVTRFASTVTLPTKTYTIYDAIDELNTLLTDVIGTGIGYTATFDGVSKVTLTPHILAPVSSITFIVDPLSTFMIARWPSTTYATAQVSNPVDFTINNDLLKTIVNRWSSSTSAIADTTNEIHFRKYPPGYTIAANEPIDIQLRDDRDHIVDLRGADWIMTVYVTIHG